MSTLTLYYSTTSNPWKLTPNKLFKVDNIASYLATQNKVVINDFQYQKNALELSIKVALPQSQSQPQSITGYKYVSIDGDTRIAYYYVKKASWRSANTIQFDLVMDVLNTFNENIDYSFKPNTRIIREHKPRIALKDMTPRRLRVDFYLLHGQGDFLDGDSCSVTDDRGTLLFTCVVTEHDQNYIIFNVDDAYDFDDAIESLESTIGSANVYFTSLDNPLSEIEVEVIEVNKVTISNVYRKIDYVSENIHPMLNCGSAVGVKLQDKSPLNIDWYLLYRNQNDPSEVLTNPVECYLLPENAIQVDSGIITAGRLDATSLQVSYYYAIGLGDKGYTASTNVSITLDNGVVLSPNVSTNDQRNVIIKRNSDNTMTISVIYGGVTSSGTTTRSEGTYNCKYITFSSMPVTLRYGNSMPTGTAWNIRDMITGGAWLVGLQTLTNSTNPAYINSINDLDRTDAKNIKLIKLPYSPYRFSYTNGVLNISSDINWDYVKLNQNGGIIYVLKLNDLHTKLTNTLPENLTINPYSKFYVTTSTLLNVSINKLRLEDDALESKMLHSEFYQPKLIYDSFTYTFELEKLDENYYYIDANRSLKIIFTMTRTINSKFLFMPKDIKFKLAESNYPEVMSVARNNEEVLYNVPYINYIRTGFNYDVKAKNLSNTSNWVGLGLSTASIGLSLLAPSVPLKVAGIAASVLSMAMSIKSTIVSTIQNEEGLKQKILQSQNQTASVSGSDDVDLMSEYSGNRLKYLVYQPNEIMQKLLKDLFYYGGYASNRMGVPNHNTRANFDYLECDASFKYDGANIPDEIMNELKNCFKAGVTYIHQTSRSVNKWDIDQVYENWENELL